MSIPINTDNSVQLSYSSFPFTITDIDNYATSNYVISNSNILNTKINTKQDTLTASTNILGVGSSISALDYNKITINKPTYFQTDWNTTITNKPTYFQTDWNSTIANKPSIYTQSETNNLLSQKEAVLTFNSPLTRSVNTIGINLNSYTSFSALLSSNYATYSGLLSCNYITNSTSGLTNYVLKGGDTMTGDLTISKTNARLSLKGGGGGGAITRLDLSPYDYTTKEPACSFITTDDANYSASLNIKIKTSGNAGNNGQYSALFIKPEGNVGINNDAPNYKLDVNGSLNSTSLYQNGTLIDFNSYLLKSGGTMTGALTINSTNPSRIDFLNIYHTSTQRFTHIPFSDNIIYLRAPVKIDFDTLSFGSQVKNFLINLYATDEYGFGITSGALMYHSMGNHNFYTNQVLKASISSTGTITATTFSGSGSLLTDITYASITGKPSIYTQNETNNLLNSYTPFTALTSSNFVNFSQLNSCNFISSSSLTNYYTKTETDGKYFLKIGGTITGQLQLTTPTGNNSLYIYSSVTNAINNIELKNNLFKSSYIGIGGGGYTGNYVDNLFIQSPTSLILNTNGNGTLATPNFIIKNNGNIGIGNLSADAGKLCIGSSVFSTDGASDGTLVISKTHVLGSHRSFKFGYDANYNFCMGDNLGAGVYTWRSTDFNIKYSDGNVGIGKTANSTYKLDVNGSLNASTIYRAGVEIDSSYLKLSGGTINGELTLAVNNKLRIEGGTSTTALSIGGFGLIQVDAPGVAGGRFSIDNDGTCITKGYIYAGGTASGMRINGNDYGDTFYQNAITISGQPANISFTLRDANTFNFFSLSSSGGGYTNIMNANTSAITLNSAVNISSTLNFGNRIQDFLINLWGTNKYGFGINNGTLRYNSDNNHAFYSGGYLKANINNTGTIEATTFSGTTLLASGTSKASKFMIRYGEQTGYNYNWNGTGLSGWFIGLNQFWSANADNDGTAYLTMTACGSTNSQYCWFGRVFVKGGGGTWSIITDYKTPTSGVYELFVTEHFDGSGNNVLRFRTGTPGVLTENLRFKIYG